MKQYEKDGSTWKTTIERRWREEAYQSGGLVVILKLSSGVSCREEDSRWVGGGEEKEGRGGDTEGSK
jgi:hypothetical protein